VCAEAQMMTKNIVFLAFYLTKQMGVKMNVLFLNKFPIRICPYKNKLSFDTGECFLQTT
jgi:hypothetical protein